MLREQHCLVIASQGMDRAAGLGDGRVGQTALCLLGIENLRLHGFTGDDAAPHFDDPNALETSSLDI